MFCQYNVELDKVSSVNDYEFIYWPLSGVVFVYVVKLHVNLSLSYVQLYTICLSYTIAC